MSFKLSFLLLLLIPAVANGQSSGGLQNSIQCSYHFSINDENGKPQSKYLNMRLDYSDGTSLFYDLFSYERDSLKTLAFDNNGKITHREEYEKILSLPRPRLNDYTILNFKSAELTQIYQQGTVSVRGTSEMTVPDWTLSDEVRSVEGYTCKKATAEYLGRNWTVWYTEEIPLPIGPWMLWGTPGLIVSAQDADSCFDFKLVWADALDHDQRLALVDASYPGKSYQKRSFRHYALPLKDAERMHYRLRTDVSYLFELTGTKSGNMDQMQNKIKKYTPLIPDAYWKDK